MEPASEHSRIDRFRLAWGPALASVAIHLVALALVAQVRIVSIPTTESAPSMPTDEVAGSDNELGIGSAAKVPGEATIARWVDRSLNAKRDPDPKKQLSALEEQTRKLEKISSPAAVRDISDVMRRAMRTRDRAYAPVDPPPPGAFDFASGLIHSARVESGPAGEDQVYYVMVDKEGRSREVEAPPGTDATAAAAIERMRRSPLLRGLYEQAVLPILDSQAAEVPHPPSP